MRLKQCAERGLRAVAVAMAVVLLANGTVMASSTIEWEGFTIRDKDGNIPGDSGYNTDGDAPAPTEKSSGRGVTVTIDQSGEKAGYGTSYYDGESISQIPYVDWQRLDDGGEFPYINVWVTDGSNHAVFAPETSSSPHVSQVKGLDFQSLQIRAYETDYNNLDWIETGAYAGDGSNPARLYDSDDNPLTFGDLGHLTVNDPGDYSSSFIGTGAPRNGTGFNIIFGDTQGNYDQPDPYEIDNVSTPTPTAIVGGVAMFGLLGMGRRKRPRQAAEANGADA